MEQRSVDSWEEFTKELDELRQNKGEFKDANASTFLFRGQRDSSWLLSTTLDRERERMLFRDYYLVIEKIRPQLESLTENTWSTPEYPEVEKLTETYDAFSLALWSGRCPGYAYMAYLRHHGFPSPLLDWTRSPYVAAYFAFNEADEESNGRVSIYAFSERENKISGNQMPVVYLYGPYVKTHRRHFLQQSEYTFCVNFDKGEWRFESYNKVFEEGLHQQAICWKFTIPTSERRKVLKALDQYNLNTFSLFGSEESLLETLATREFDLAEKQRE